MNLPISALVRSLFEKDSLDQCSEEELRSVVEKYPYYAPAQVLLTEKLRYTHHSQYETELQKTSLFFQNPVWFHYLLSDESASFRVQLEDLKKTGSAPEGKEQTDSITEQREEFHPALTLMEAEKTLKVVHIEGRDMAEDAEINDRPDHIPENVEAPVPEDIPPPSVSETEIPREAPILVETESQAASEPMAMAGEGAGTEAPEPQEAETPQEGPIPDLPHRDLPGLADLRFEKLDDNAKLPAFEPLFTIDYFASQGIKAPENDKPTDQFGKQLRSFTEWLKTMKKLSAAEIEKTVVAGSEEKVISLAQVSNTAADVLTETMAEVWTRQGNLQKARDIYKKLSLQNPDKSAYFAAKIEALK